MNRFGSVDGNGQRGMWSPKGHVREVTAKS